MGEAYRKRACPRERLPCPPLSSFSVPAPASSPPEPQCLALLLSLCPCPLRLPSLPYPLKSTKERERRAHSGLGLRERGQRQGRADPGSEWGLPFTAREVVEKCYRQRATGGNEQIRLLRIHGSRRREASLRLYGAF